ncbi:hypothetical protein [Paenibacillus segetis]|uniref:Photosynthesis system II assembly factor Ycf48/Hcf136-like domain-containing protein n=1 Tax=Paenibacillus segetis TaxID=1325360 RepID=A0ABQ1YGP1_9BACL|nr:hypothetical protein [Paenibacillus segetis]GGH23671.1 hypothetical protein GCM10008013_22960 [Paenibacillus segetis]
MGNKCRHILIRLGILSICMVLLTTCFPSGKTVDAAASSWKWTQQTGKVNSELHDIIALDSGVKLAVGDDATIQRSESPGSWNIVPSPGKGNINTATSNGTLAIIGDDQGTIASTKDGLTWTKGSIKGTLLLSEYNDYYKSKAVGKQKLTQKNIEWLDVMWDGKQFIATACAKWQGEFTYEQPLVAVSTQGTEWEIRPLKSTTYINLFEAPITVVKFQNKWLAVAAEGVFESKDLKKWTFYETKFDGDINDATTNGTTMVTVGYNGKTSSGTVYISNDGIKYKKVSSPLFDNNTSIEGIMWDGEEFIAVGDYGTIYHSADGNKWTMEPEQEGGVYRHPLFYIKYMGLKSKVNRISKMGDTYLAVGNLGTIRSINDSDEMWKVETSGSLNDLYAIDYSNGKYVITGEGTFRTSSNGDEWNAIDDERVNEGSSFFEQTAGSGLFLFSCMQRARGNVTVPQYLYRDGELINIDSYIPERFNDVAVIGGEMRVYGSTSTATSMDGITWKKMSGVQAVPVARNGKLWIGFKDDGYYTSKDALLWKKTKTTLDGSTNWPDFMVKKAVWTGKKFVGIQNGELIESVDGITWITKMRVKYSYFTDLAVSSNGVIATVGSKGMIYFCEDGKTWTKIASPTLKDLTDITWDGKRFLAVGYNGVIVIGQQ